MKKLLSVEDIESQVGLELPERRMLTLYRLTVLDIHHKPLADVDVDVKDINVALALCADLLQKYYRQGANECRIQQH